MKRIEVHSYRTPTADNRDCPCSVGVMNLTEIEVGMIRDFVLSLERVRIDVAREAKATATEAQASAMVRAVEAERAMRGERPDLYGAYTEMADEARRYMTGERVRVTFDLRAAGLTPAEIKDVEDQLVRENSKPEPEPEPVRNRFSGLDIE